MLHNGERKRLRRDQAFLEEMQCKIVACTDSDTVDLVHVSTSWLDLHHRLKSGVHRDGLGCDRDKDNSIVTFRDAGLA